MALILRPVVNLRPPRKFLGLLLVVLTIPAFLRAEQSVCLVWNASPDPRTAGYVLAYGTASGAYNQATNVGKVTEAAVGGLNEGQTYYFAVFAYGGASLQSDYSNEVAYTVPWPVRTPVVRWPPPADIPYGMPLGPEQLNATADLEGTFVYDPPAGTVLPVGNSQILTAVFQPGGGVNGLSVTNSVAINVQRARLVVRAENKTRPQGSANPPFTATYDGWVNGDTPEVLSNPVTFTTPAGPESLPGIYPIAVAGGSHANYVVEYVGGTLTVTAPLPLSLVPPSSRAKWIASPGQARTPVSLRLALGTGEHAPLTLTLVGPAGARCQVLTSADLIDWQPVVSVTLSGQSMPFIASDHDAPARFYRVQSDGGAEMR